MKSVSTILGIFIAVSFFSATYGSLAEKKLINKLLSKYEPMVRPVSNYDDVIKVHFGLSIQQIVDLDEKNQLLTTSMYMNWAWDDAYMTWNKSDYENISTIRLPAKKLWKPDILIYNSAVDSFDQMLQTNLVIYNTGRVEWLPPGLFKTTCDVDIRYFPFDEQKCLIKFGAWTFHGGLVDLVVSVSSAAQDSYTQSGEWDLLSMEGKRNSVNYTCCDYPFVDVTYTIHMRRRTLFYGFNLILPCVLVCSLTILVFLLPADSGERITLGITVLLALVVFLQLVADNLPPTDVIPLLGKYFACSIVMVTSSVICTVISLSFHHTTAATTNEMPEWIRVVFLNILPKVLRMERPGENSAKRKLLDGEDPGLLLGNSESTPLVKIEDRVTSNGSGGELTNLAEAESEMKKILDELTFITDRMHNDDEDEKSAQEWRFAAMVLDRFCVWFFIIYFIFSTVFTIGMAPGILLPYPNDTKSA